MTRHIVVRACALLVLICSSASELRAQSPSPVDLGTLGGCCSRADVVSNTGLVSGLAWTAGGESRVFVWTPATGMIDAGAAGGSSRVWAVSGTGMVVGQRAASQYHAFAWSAATGMVDLPTLPGGTESTALAVNNTGVVVGRSFTAGHTNAHAFTWTAANGMMDLGTLGGDSSEAWGVNDSGLVVGDSTTASGETHAFAWTQSQGLTDLGTLGGITSAAAAVNASGVVVGGSNVATGKFHAFMWTLAGGMIDLGLPPGSVNSDAVTINDAGVIVGSGTDAAYHSLPFEWTAATGIVSLSVPVGQYSSPHALNAAGLAVGFGGSSASWTPDAFAWPGQDGWVFLLPLAGLTGAAAVAVNDTGRVVGLSGGGADQRATLWQVASCAAGVLSCRLADIAVSGGPFTYDGTSHGAACTVTDPWANGAGVAGSCELLYNGSPTEPTNAGTYAVTAFFTSQDPQHSDGTGAGVLTINRATPKVTVTDETAIWDDRYHGRVHVKVTGVGGATVAGTMALSFGAPAGSLGPSDVGSYTVTATFTSSDPNYTNANGGGTITILCRPPIITWATPATEYAGTAVVIGSHELNATVNTQGKLVYTPPAGTLLGTGTFTLTAAFTPANASYCTAAKSVLLTVVRQIPRPLK